MFPQYDELFEVFQGREGGTRALRTDTARGIAPTLAALEERQRQQAQRGRVDDEEDKEDGEVDAEATQVSAGSAWRQTTTEWQANDAFTTPIRPVRRTPSTASTASRLPRPSSSAGGIDGLRNCHEPQVPHSSATLVAPHSAVPHWSHPWSMTPSVTPFHLFLN